MSVKQGWLLACAVALVLAAAPVARADNVRPDDTVEFDVSAEDWVATKTARVILAVDAATPASEAGHVRASMKKAVAATASADWRLTGFGQAADQAGMQSWNATFSARLPENQLGDLSEAAKKASKPGLQVSVAEVDYTPTLDEVEAARTGLRQKLMQQALAEAASLGKASGRTYRVQHLSFNDMDMAPAPIPMARKMMATAAPSAPSGNEPQRASHAVMHAQVTLAALPPDTAAATR